MPTSTPAPRGWRPEPLVLVLAAVLLGAAADAHAQELRANAVGPPLDPIAAKIEDRRWLMAFLLEPQSLQPGTRMPKSDLTPQEAADMVAYMLSLSRQQAAPPPPPGNAERGGTLFVDHGCRSCHSLARAEPSLGPNLAGIGAKVKPGWLAAWIRDPRAYHASTPMPKVPLADADVADLAAFLAQQRGDEEVLAAAPNGKGDAGRGRTLVEDYECYSCHAVAGRIPGPALVVPATAPAGEDALALGRALMDWYRCGGCHELEGQPGRLREHLDGDTLAPPKLDGEGARVQHSWLVSYLQEPTVLRAWLPTRMPHYGFTPEEGAAFAAYFAALASVPAADEPRPVAEPALLADGRARFEDYRCVQCHPAAGAPADGIPLADRAIDLDLARARLRPSWIAEFLARPSVIAGPRTRMPSVFFASDGSPAVAEPGREIEAITAFLLHMDESLAAPSAPTPEAVDWSTVDY